MTNESSESEPAGDAPTPATIAATENPVQLTVGLVEDQRIPDGMVCMGSYRNGRLVARSVMPPEAWAQIDQYGIFDEPVQVVLVARAAPPGVQCQLYAMVPLPEEEEDEPRVAPIPLGHIVRYERDRVHPDSLPLEAVDLLQKIIEGKTSEVVDRALADLLGL